MTHVILFRRLAVLSKGGAGAILFLSASLAQAVPHLLNYQGRVSVSGQNFSGQGQFKFALINNAASVAYWKNDGDPGNVIVPALGVPLAVQNGHYAVLLGDTSRPNMQSLPPEVFTEHTDVKLRVWFSDGVNGFQLMSPDQKIAAVGYAIMAEDVKDGAITAAKLAPGAAQANLDAGNLGVVAPGGSLLSDRENDGALLAAGYVLTGTLEAKAEDHWRPAAAAPERRRSHTAVARGLLGGFLVWGGYVQPSAGAPEVLSNSGAVYNDDTDTWTPMSTQDAPSARSLHTAVAHNGNMFVWGGSGATPFLGDGGSYTPSNNTWIPIAPAAAITPRRSHTAVVINGEMIVFGGEIAANSYSGTGARYNFSTGNWTQIAAGQGSPGGRARHTAVVADNKMIVWGGLTSGGETATGSIYDSANNIWTPMSTVGAPAARQNHQAVMVYAGSDKMIVWGGNAGLVPLASGGIYDIEANTWSPMSATNSPSARHGNTFTFVGFHILAWGGQIPGSYLNTGGAYFYPGDDWDSINTFPAPPARSSHSAVWNERLTFVFGGRNQSETLNDLWIWQPRRSLYLYTRP